MTTNTNTTETLYGVARDSNLIGDLYPTVQLATQQHQHLTEQEAELGLEPSLQVVTVDVKTSTTYSKPKVYKEPTPEPDASVEETTPAPTQPVPTD